MSAHNLWTNVKRAAAEGHALHNPKRNPIPKHRRATTRHDHKRDGVAGIRAPGEHVQEQSEMHLASDDFAERLRREIGLTFDEVQAVLGRRGVCPSHLRPLRDRVDAEFARIDAQARRPYHARQRTDGVTVSYLAGLYGVTPRAIKNAIDRAR